MNAPNRRIVIFQVAMARVDLLVDGVKHRFVVSTAATDSVFPRELVPFGRLGPKTDLRLAAVNGSEFDISGTYQAKLESPGVDFSISFPLTAAHCAAPILGSDFICKVNLTRTNWIFLFLVNQTCGMWF